MEMMSHTESPRRGVVAERLLVTKEMGTFVDALQEGKGYRSAAESAGFAESAAMSYMAIAFAETVVET